LFILRDIIPHSHLSQHINFQDPLTFSEDPIASTGRLGREDVSSPGITRVSDLVDIDALMKKTRELEADEARIQIKNHIYVEDIDERTRNVKIDKDARQLLKTGRELGKLYGEEESNGDDDTVDEDKVYQPNKPRMKIPVPNYATPYPDNNAGYKSKAETRRPRWKYAAQIINTHALENPPNSDHHGKATAARAKARRHGRVVDGNTLIEEDGKLRAATVAELEQTSWKHVRNESEFMFRGVKEAWLRRELEGEVGGWGLQEEVNKVEQIEAGKDDAEEESEDDTADEDASEDGDTNAEESETTDDK
jgi:hypothetical protein